MDAWSGGLGPSLGAFRKVCEVRGLFRRTAKASQNEGSHDGDPGFIEFLMLFSKILTTAAIVCRMPLTIPRIMVKEASRQLLARFKKSCVAWIRGMCSNNALCLYAFEQQNKRHRGEASHVAGVPAHFKSQCPDISGFEGSSPLSRVVPALLCLALRTGVFSDWGFGSGCPVSLLVA